MEGSNHIGIVKIYSMCEMNSNNMYRVFIEQGLIQYISQKIKIMKHNFNSKLTLTHTLVLIHIISFT